MFHLIVKIYFLWRERYFRGTLPEFHTRTESGLHPFERQLPIAQRATFAPVPLHSPASCAHLYEQFRRPDDSGKLMAPVPLLPQLQSVVRLSSSALPWSPCPQTRHTARRMSKRSPRLTAWRPSTDPRVWHSRTIISLAHAARPLSPAPTSTFVR